MSTIFGGGGGGNKGAEKDARIRARESEEDAGRARQKGERTGRAVRGKRQLLRFGATLGSQANLGAGASRET